MEKKRQNEFKWTTKVLLDILLITIFNMFTIAIVIIGVAASIYDRWWGISMETGYTD